MVTEKQFIYQTIKQEEEESSFTWETALHGLRDVLLSSNKNCLKYGTPLVPKMVITLVSLLQINNRGRFMNIVKNIFLIVLLSWTYPVWADKQEQDSEKLLNSLLHIKSEKYL